MPTDSLPRTLRPEGRPAGTAAAFSLVELMVAVSIFGLLIVILASVSQSIGDAWVFVQKRTSRQQSGRAIMDFITRDLQCALPPVVPGSTTSLQMIRNPFPAGAEATFKSGHTLFWQAPISTDTTQGDIAIVGYFIRWSPDNKATLCRLFITPKNGTKNGTDYYRITTSPGDWINADVANAMAPADASSHYLGLMSENVVGFWAEPLDAYGSVITQPNANFDSRLGYKDSMGATFPPGSLPPAIRVSIAMLDPRSAARLPKSLQDKANAAGNADTFVAAVMADSSLQPVFGGIRAQTATVPLINSR